MGKMKLKGSKQCCNGNWLSRYCPRCGKKLSGEGKKTLKEELAFLKNRKNKKLKSLLGKIWHLGMLIFSIYLFGVVAYMFII